MMTINLNKIAAKLKKPYFMSRGSDHAGMIGFSKRIPSGPVASRLCSIGGEQHKQAGHMTAQLVIVPSIPLDSQKPSTHDTAIGFI